MRPPSRSTAQSTITRWLALPLLILPGIALVQLSARIPAVFLWLGWLAVSVICFLVYWADKHRAGSGAWRIPESTLHLLELAGGWPGALLAQQILRHKTVKPGFQFVFWTIVALHQLLALDCVLGWRLTRSAWQVVAG